MAFIPPGPSAGHPRKPLTQAQLRKMQEKFEKSSEIIEEIQKKEAGEKGGEKKSAHDGVDEVAGWL